MTTDVAVEVNPSEPIRIGGSVAGKVRVASKKQLVVKRVLVRAKWRTSGAGEVRTGVGEDTTLPGFTLEPGVPYEAMFIVDIPKGPVTLAGSLIRVNWYVEADLDVSWAAAPRGTCDITVLGATRDGPPQHGYRDAAALTLERSGVAQTPRRPSTLERVLVRTAAFSIGPALVALLLWTHITSLAIVAILGVGAINLAMLQRWFKAFLSERRLGTLSVIVEPSIVERGTPITVRASILPARDRTIDGVDMWLRCAEYAALGAGQQTSTHWHRDDIGHTSLAKNRELIAGREEVFEGKLFIPKTALPTLKLENNSISWFASVQVQYDGQELAEQVEIEVTA